MRRKTTPAPPAATRSILPEEVEPLLDVMATGADWLQWLADRGVSPRLALAHLVATHPEQVMGADMAAAAAYEQQHYAVALGVLSGSIDARQGAVTLQALRWHAERRRASRHSVDVAVRQVPWSSTEERDQLVRMAIAELPGDSDG